MDKTFNALKKNVIQAIKLNKNTGLSWREIYYKLGNRIGIYCGRTCVIPWIFLIKSYRLKPKKEDIPERIAIVETGVLGDTMLILDALKSLVLFCRKKQYKLDIICGAVTAKILQEYAGVEANYITYKDRKKISVKEFREIGEKLQDKSYKYLLRRDSNPAATYLSGLVHAEESFYYSYDSRLAAKRIAKYNNMFFTEIIQIKKDVFIPLIWEKLLHRIGVTDYIAKQGGFSDRPDADKSHLPLKKYIVICPEASKYTRNISIVQCFQIVKYLKQFDYDVAFSTNSIGMDYNHKLKMIAKQMKVYAYLGNLSFSKYVTLLAGADLVISCDSGSGHLSAALGVKTICLSGYWDGSYFYPYRYKGNKLKNKPITIRAEKPSCAFCSRGVPKRDETKKRCYEHMILGEPYICIQNIKMEDVLSNIKSCISEVE